MTRAKKLQSVKGGFKISGSKYEGKWPWVVAFGYVLGGQFEVFCGGVLIAPSLVATAAHNRVAESGFKAVVGRHSLHDVTEIVEVKNNERVLRGLDISIVELEKEADQDPPKVPADDTWMEEATGCFLLGWGSISDEVEPLDSFAVNVPLVKWPTCSGIFARQRATLGDYQFCAGRVGAGLYPGDSGMPVVFEKDEEQWVVGVATDSCIGASGPIVTAAVKTNLISKRL